MTAMTPCLPWFTWRRRQRASCNSSPIETPIVRCASGHYDYSAFNLTRLLSDDLVRSLQFIGHLRRMWASPPTICALCLVTVRSNVLIYKDTHKLLRYVMTVIQCNNILKPITHHSQFNYLTTLLWLTTKREVHCVSKKTSPTFLAITRESIDGFL